MSEPRLDLRNRYLAALLAFLIPGAGHLYQRRFFKAGVYGICILGTFFYGMALGDWQVVYYRHDSANRPYGYFAQFWVGLPALPALVQYQRFQPEAEWSRELDVVVSDVPFSGTVESGGEPIAGVTGRISLSEVPTPLGPDIQGTFEGRLHLRRGDEGEPIRFDVAEGFQIEPPVLGKQERLLQIDLRAPHEQLRALAPDPHRRLTLQGFIPRSFSNWFEAPLDEKEQQRLHRELGTLFELASVFTWVAGLLNILAIWDALEGPAYGIGDESPGADGTESASASPAAADASAAASASAPAAASARATADR